MVNPIVGCRKLLTWGIDRLYGAMLNSVLLFKPSGIRIHRKLFSGNGSFPIADNEPRKGISIGICLGSFRVCSLRVQPKKLTGVMCPVEYLYSSPNSLRPNEYYQQTLFALLVTELPLNRFKLRC